MSRKLTQAQIPILSIIAISVLLFNIYLLHELQAPAAPESTKQEAERIATTCKRGGQCYENEFGELAKSKSLVFAEQTLYALWDIDLATRRCHVLSHTITKEATRQNPEKWKEYAESVNYTTCSAGFLHGVFEAHIGDDKNFRLTPEVINELCLSKGDFYRKHNCVHYMGHLLMIEYGGVIGLALKGCQGINEGLTVRCYTGVFMEDSFPLALVEHKIRDKLSNRHDPGFVEKQRQRCLKFAGDKAIACWTDMGENFGVFYDNPQRAYDACFKAPKEVQRRECFLKSAGLFAINPDYSTDEKLVGICIPTEHNDNLYKNCVGRMISSVLYYSPNFSERAVKLCSNVKEKEREGCFAQVKKQIEMTASQAGSDKAKFCQTLPSEHKNLCLN